MTESLFPDLIPLQLAPVERLSPDRRRTLRQARDIQAGRHPLTRERINPDPIAKCGNCRFRQLIDYHHRTYPKCVWSPPGNDSPYLDDLPFCSHSAGTDVRAWWPACKRHEYGDPKLSPDAARSGPA